MGGCIFYFSNEERIMHTATELISVNGYTKIMVTYPHFNYCIIVNFHKDMVALAKHIQLYTKRRNILSLFTMVHKLTHSVSLVV